MAHTTVFATTVPEGELRRLAFEADPFQVLSVRLGPGEQLPHHATNSQVLLVLVEGAIAVEAEGRTQRVGVGEVCFLPFATEMQVFHREGEPARFLIVKAPHPKQLAGAQ